MGLARAGWDLASDPRDDEAVASHTAVVCYSAMVEQSIKALGIRFQARIQLDLFEELFRRRVVDERVRIPKGMELNFLEPTNAAEERIKRAILDYRQYQGQKWESELRRQQERLDRAVRSLALRSTKKAESERRIAANKVEFYRAKLTDLFRDHPEPRDGRIFPQWYAPVVVVEQGETVVRPMRYHMRPGDKPASFDAQFDGLYNARRDNLTGFWRAQFGRRHGVLTIKSFFENVASDAYEHRQLAPGEAARNLVVQFDATRPGEFVDADAASSPILVPCVWDRWVVAGEPALLSFAAITDEPPSEVRETGHDRCVVALREQNVARWLQPEVLRDDELFQLLGDREPFVFRHRLAG